MCNCCKSNLPDFTIEDRNHRAISDGFNAVEVAANQARLIAEMSEEREVMIRKIQSLEMELGYRIARAEPKE